MPNPVFTIGHSTHAITEFLAILRQHGATALADVRSVPYSRFQPQFNRESLKEVLKNCGIEYVFFGNELGARSEDKACYEGGKIRYRRLAQTIPFKKGIERIQQGADTYRIAVMCAEQEPLECHRTLLVARQLEASGTPVVHIHADGHLESHAEALRRLLKMTKLSEQDLFRSPSELIDEAYAKQEQRVAYVDDRAEGEEKEAVA